MKSHLRNLIQDGAAVLLILISGSTGLYVGAALAMR